VKRRMKENLPASTSSAAAFTGWPFLAPFAGRPRGILSLWYIPESWNRNSWNSRTPRDQHESKVLQNSEIQTAQTDKTQTPFVPKGKFRSF
jgi:hypothetical protein